MSEPDEIKKYLNSIKKATKGMTRDEIAYFMDNMLSKNGFTNPSRPASITFANMYADRMRENNNYRYVNNDCCRNCKHWRDSYFDGAPDFCQLMFVNVEVESASVSATGICDKFER